MTRGLRLFGWGLWLLALPLAVTAAVHPPNEFRATLGISALDCDGPFETWLFAAPALLGYGVAFVLHARRWRRPLNLAVALLSLGLCAAVAANVVRADPEARRQSAECG